jgi:hypothetical protein
VIRRHDGKPPRARNRNSNDTTVYLVEPISSEALKSYEMAAVPSTIPERFFTALCWFQGSYYFATGVWPILHVRSFKWVTGEKTDNLPTGLEADHWLLMTVSALIVAIAITILAAAWRRARVIEIGVLAVSAAIGLTTIDIVYTIRGVILPIYLLDAAIEIPLIVCWIGILTFLSRSGVRSNNP